MQKNNGGDYCRLADSREIAELMYDVAARDLIGRVSVTESAVSAARRPVMYASPARRPPQSAATHRSTPTGARRSATSNQDGDAHAHRSIWSRDGGGVTCGGGAPTCCALTCCVLVATRGLSGTGSNKPRWPPEAQYVRDAL